MSDYVKLFQSITPDKLRKESDDISTIPSFTVVEEKSQFLIDYISNIENKPLNDINSFILRYHTSFLNYRLFTESTASRSSMQRLFTNVNFLNLFFNQISKLNLDSYEIAFLNRIAYDYWTSPNKNQDVCNLLLQISGYVNNTLIIKLSSKIAVNDARILAMICNSTDNQEIRVHRINRFLVNCDNPYLDTQEMIDIMFFIYDRFLYAIVYTLLEDESCCKELTDDKIEQYDRLMRANLSILLSTTTDKMVTILTEYGYIISSGKAKVVIKLKDIKDDRLQNAIKIVEENPCIKEIP